MQLRGEFDLSLRSCIYALRRTISRALNVQLRGLLTDMTTIATCQKVLPACSESPGPSRLRESDDVDKLVIPGALEELDPDDYPSSLFWTQASWNIHKKN